MITITWEFLQNPSFLVASSAFLSFGLLVINFAFGFKRRYIDEPKRALRAIAHEIGLIASWATGGYPDYSLPEYKKLAMFEHFYHPWRMVFEFDYPIIKRITDRSFIKYFSDNFIERILSLQQATSNFFQVIRRLRQIAMNYPNLFLSVCDKFSGGGILNKIDRLDEEELRFVNLIFLNNYRIHHDFIGGEWNQMGLFNKFRNAQAALTNEGKSAQLKWKQFWFWFMLISSIIMILLGFAILLFFAISLFK